MNTLGQELKREREARRVSLQDIARITKINLNYLIALEEDRLNILPGEFFIKGTIRAYAKCIGLDENQALNLYLQAGRHQDPEVRHPKKRRTMDITPARWKKLLLIVFLPLLVAAVLVLTRPWDQASAPKRKARAFSGQARPLPAEKSTLEAGSLPQPRPAAQAKNLSLALSFQEEVWIRITADGQLLEEGLLQPGEQRIFTAQDRVEMRLGKPGGVDLSINGRKAKPLGPSGTPRTYEITTANYKDYLAE
jgi:cytoskeleton protein RodZ